MNTKHKNLVTIGILLPFILICLACPSKECKDTQDIILKLTLDYSPLVDTFNIGDTLRIFSKFSDLIEDTKSGEFINLKDFRFYTLVNIRKFEDGISVCLDTQESQIVDANVELNFINYTLGKGTGINIDEHNYEDGCYEFSFGFVLEKSGLYVVGADSALGLSNATDDQRFEGQCPNQELIGGGYHRPLNSNTELYNFILLDQTQIYMNVTEEEFQYQSLYAFYVKE